MRKRIKVSLRYLSNQLKIPLLHPSKTKAHRKNIHMISHTPSHANIHKPPSPSLHRTRGYLGTGIPDPPPILFLAIPLFNMGNPELCLLANPPGGPIDP
jgi:hypothetical protein